MLSPEQLDGARFLAARTVAMLADAPGVGKSAQIVRACEYVRAESVTGIVPNRTLCVNMAREFKLWHLWGMPVTILETGNSKVPDKGLVLTTYALASRDPMREKLARRACDVLFCDEAHALKELSSVRTKAVMRKKGIAHAARHVWLATGSPVKNHAGELFVFAKAAGAWPGNYKQFIERFCVTIEDGYGGKIVGSKNHDELKALLAPVYLRRTKVEGRPALHVTDMTVDAGFDPYSQLPPEDLQRIKDAIALGDLSFADVPALASIRRLVGLAKATGIAELAASDLEGGYPKVLVFARHTDVIMTIAAKLEKYGCEIYDGNVGHKKRLRIYDDFQTKPGIRAVVIQNQAGGEGGTWTAANRVLLGEPEWTPDDNMQMICRAWRRGQTEPVHASFVSLAGSLDEQITRTAKRKTGDIEQIV